MAASLLYIVELVQNMSEPEAAAMILKLLQ
jgi:hypothetical protein